MQGAYPLEKALDTRGIDGSRLGDELERIGYAGNLPPGHVTPFAYLELHVEQGPVLDHDRVRIGVVTGVQGISWREITVEGAANHAGHHAPRRCGMTQVWPRRGPTCFCAELAARTGTLATVGSVRFEPGLINVIPSRAVFTVDMRDPDADRLSAANAEFTDWLTRLEQEEGVRVSSGTLVDFAPAAFARVSSTGWRRRLNGWAFPGGAWCPAPGHDAQMMARICPTGMIFVPSRGGAEPLSAGIHRAGRPQMRGAGAAGNGSGSAGCGNGMSSVAGKSARHAGGRRV